MMKAARKNMIKEKKRLLSDGVLTEDETHYFMKKYRYVCMYMGARLLLLSCVWPELRRVRQRRCVGVCLGLCCLLFHAIYVESTSK